ncbi:MAG: hypothetical protein RMA76_36260 [Deltaproteobacteria bacterium]
MSDEPKWSKFARGLADSARTATSDLGDKLAGVAATAREKAAKAGETTRFVIESLGNASEDRDHLPGLTQRFVRALSGLEGQLDREATAVAIGYLGGGGVGVSQMAGTEIFYLRPDGPVRGQLRVSTVSGQVARLAFGASTGAYAACFYGDRDVLSRPTRRRGADVEILVASIGFFRVESHRDDRRAAGWMVGLGAGVGLGVPILSELSGFDLTEAVQGSFPLDARDAATIEAVVKSAPDRGVRRRIAQAL